LTDGPSPNDGANAVGELEALLDGYQEARDRLPDHLADPRYVEKLDATLELREHIEALADADLPLEFGRD
jgi:hypothetical protein